MDSKNSETGKDFNNSLLSYYNKHYASLEDNLRQVLLRANEENIHQLRLTIKNLRAVYKFLISLDNERNIDKEHFTLLSGLFETAGKVREEQINLMLMRKQKPGIGRDLMIKYLVGRKKSAYCRLHKALDEFDISRMEAGKIEYVKYIQNCNKEKTFIHTGNFIHGRFKKIRKLQSGLSDKNLHSIRKKLKSVNTIADLMININPESEMNELFLRIKPLEVLIGKWHNKMILLEAIHDECLKRTGSAHSIAGIKKIKRKIGDQNADLKRQIDKQLCRIIKWYYRKKIGPGLGKGH